ncbi:uncharacterized protein A4U43_UnF6950 [Asparagus officinalis]|uniref:Uncharacterized protein n=1 Tax=Asparagus officinalis TaxID=4686 RepID=A0A1R3L6D7_ASPOF|nr:uncharacterized protein A4U43_UnF6950 [Asparagus officinalis]
MKLRPIEWLIPKTHNLQLQSEALDKVSDRVTASSILESKRDPYRSLWEFYPVQRFILTLAWLNDPRSLLLIILQMALPDSSSYVHPNGPQSPVMIGFCRSELSSLKIPCQTCH